METTEWVGIVAGICTTVAILPQIKHSWETKEVDNVSPGMFIIMMCGVGLWTVYGILKTDWAIIVTNGISFLLNSFLLYILLRYGGKND